MHEMPVVAHVYACVRAQTKRAARAIVAGARSPPPLYRPQSVSRLLGLVHRAGLGRLSGLLPAARGRRTNEEVVEDVDGARRPLEPRRHLLERARRAQPRDLALVEQLACGRHEVVTAERVARHSHRLHARTHA
eukprot:6195298-Pleurochrysis_carterae.AAC.1